MQFADRGGSATPLPFVPKSPARTLAAFLHGSVPSRAESCGRVKMTFEWSQGEPTRKPHRGQTQREKNLQNDRSRSGGEPLRPLLPVWSSPGGKDRFSIRATRNAGTPCIPKDKQTSRPEQSARSGKTSPDRCAARRRESAGHTRSSKPRTELLDPERTPARHE